jgi:hypothetical protein
MDIRICGAVLAGLSSGSLAQDDSATWLWDVTTQDGDSIVEPGETATVTLSLLMEVGAGKGELIAFADTIFDTLGNGQAANGAIIGWQVLNNLDFHPGDTTTTDGVNMFGTSASQCLPPQYTPCNLDNPIDIFAFDWATNDFRSYSVEYATSTFGLVVVTDIFGDNEQFIDVEVAEALISFQVVPTPPAAPVIAFAMGACSFRRRRGARL